MARSTVFAAFIMLLLTALGLAHPSATTEPASANNTQQCTPEIQALAVRKEWYSVLPCLIFCYDTHHYRSNLTLPERSEYIDAVLCLMELPSQLDDVPGARNRFDDFAATHINLTLHIHLDGQFLSWHRNFVWLYETALREECGYHGYQP